MLASEFKEFWNDRKHWNQYIATDTRIQIDGLPFDAEEGGVVHSVMWAVEHAEEIEIIDGTVTKYCHIRAEVVDTRTLKDFYEVWKNDRQRLSGIPE